MGEKRYQTLDGMRGLCALIVALLHFDTAINNGHVLNHGWLSVDLFFVLSGFVISNAYEDKLQAGLGSGKFLRARFKRLTPTGWLGTLMVALSVSALYFSGKMASIPNMSFEAILIASFFAFLLLPISISPVAKTFRYMGTGNFPINVPLWSLQGEWLINIAYAQILYFLRLPSLLLLYIGPAIYLAVCSLDGMWVGLLPGLCQASAGFIAGIVIYRCHRKGMLQKLPVVRPGVIYAAWFFICSIPATGPVPAFQTASALLVAPFLICLLIRSERPMPVALNWLGAVSYPLYTSHLAIMNLAILLFPVSRHHNILWLLPMGAGALLLAAGIDRMISPRWTERSYRSIPFRRQARQTALPD
jgi:peptidoglycan/LPS O-acetylase OafA/YrhL